MMDSELAVVASRLSRRFAELEAVRDVDLEVRGGEMFAFLGPNGAGKSTTIKMLCSPHPRRVLFRVPRGRDPAIRKDRVMAAPRSIRARLKNVLIVAVMIFALLLSPFALPITMVVRWVRGRATKTQIVRGAEAQTSLRSEAQRLSS